MIRVLLYTNNSDFFRHIIDFEIPFKLSSFLNYISNEESNQQSEEFLLQTKILQVYFLLLRKTPDEQKYLLVDQIMASDVIDTFQEIDTDDSNYILRLLKSYSI